MASKALVCDSGLYPYTATALTGAFDSVVYYTPTQAAFPISRPTAWGKGLPGIERSNRLWRHAVDADLIVFPDLHFADEQWALRLEQAPVWGAGEAEELELDRVALKRWQEAAGLPTPEWWALDGMDALREHLDDPANEDQFIKLSRWRGDAETYHHRVSWLSQTWLNHMDEQLGSLRDAVTFVAEAAIPDAIEVGCDTFTVDGQYPTLSVVGYENKDLSYLGWLCPTVELPAALAAVNRALTPPFAEARCRSMFSTELRVTPDGIGYLIDLTVRNGSPPSESLLELFTNWPAIMMAAAESGTLIEPEPVARYVAQIVLRSRWAFDRFLQLRFPEEMRHLVKLHGHAILDGVDTVVALGMDVIGSTVGLGDTPEEAADQALEVAHAIEAHELEYDEHAFEVLWDRIEQGRERGIPWGKEVSTNAQAQSEGAAQAAGG